MFNPQHNISKSVIFYNLPIILILWVKVQNDIRSFKKTEFCPFFPLAAEIFFGIDPWDFSRGAE